MSSDLEVVSYRPGAEDYAWVFGGVPAVQRVRPGTVLELFTEDCFAGRVRDVDSLPSVVCEFPYLYGSVALTDPSTWLSCFRAVGVERWSRRRH